MNRATLVARVTTASVLIAVVVVVVFFFTTPMLAALFGLILLFAAWEWAALIALRSFNMRLAYVVLIGTTAASAYILRAAVEVFPSAYLVAGAWLLATAAVVSMECGAEAWLGGQLGKGLLGFTCLIPAWWCLVFLHARQPHLVLALLVILWSADSSAYLVGGRWGRARLAPRVSPGKTRLGMIASIVTSCVVAAGVAAALGYNGYDALQFIGIAVVTVLASIIGDLFESVLKRQRGVKDSGDLLPGHGGVLDRVDSLLAAAPVYTAGLLKGGMIV